MSLTWNLGPFIFVQIPHIPSQDLDPKNQSICSSKISTIPIVKIRNWQDCAAQVMSVLTVLTYFIDIKYLLLRLVLSCHIIYDMEHAHKACTHVLALMIRSCGNREIASGTNVCACKCLFSPPLHNDTDCHFPELCDICDWVMLCAPPWHWLMRGRSLEGHIYHTHTHMLTHKHTQRVCMRFVLQMKALCTADLAVWKGAYLRG